MKTLNIITPIYNTHDLCIRMINSFLNSDCSFKFKFFFIDDSCPDNLTKNKFNNMISKIGFKYHYHINSKNIGASASRNVGFRLLSVGDKCIFFDSDDIWEKNINFLISQLLDLLEDCDFVFTPVKSKRNAFRLVNYANKIIELKKFLLLDYGKGERLIAMKKKERNTDPFLDKFIGSEITGLYNYGTKINSFAIFYPHIIREYRDDNYHSIMKNLKNINLVNSTLDSFFILFRLSLINRDINMLFFSLLRIIKWGFLKIIYS